MNNIKKIIITILIGFVLVGVLVGGIIPSFKKDNKKVEKNETVESQLNGAIELPELDKALTNSNYELKESKYSVSNKSIDVRLDYKGKVLMVGTVNAIRNIVASNLEKDYNEINLMITQDDPSDYVKYTYENNSWDKEVE